jgi:hypothetical protein
MITFTWSVTKINCISNQNGNANVVKDVYVVCTGVDGEHTFSITGCYGLEYNEDSFIPYNELTEEQVLGWVWDSGCINKEAIESAIDQKIQEIIDPPIVSLPLPW